MGKTEYERYRSGFRFRDRLCKFMATRSWNRTILPIAKSVGLGRKWGKLKDRGRGKRWRTSETLYKGGTKKEGGGKKWKTESTTKIQRWGKICDWGLKAYGHSVWLRRLSKVERYVEAMTWGNVREGKEGWPREEPNDAQIYKQMLITWKLSH